MEQKEKMQGILSQVEKLAMEQEEILSQAEKLAMEQKEKMQGILSQAEKLTKEQEEKIMKGILSQAEELAKQYVLLESCILREETAENNTEWEECMRLTREVYNTIKEGKQLLIEAFQAMAEAVEGRTTEPENKAFLDFWRKAAQEVAKAYVLYEIIGGTSFHIADFSNYRNYEKEAETYTEENIQKWLRDDPK